MQIYMEAIDAYLKEHPLQMRCPNVQTLLDILYCCYYQQNGVESTQVRELFRQLDGILGKLSLQENDRVFDLTCALCGAHKKEAFHEGLLVGFRLYHEIYNRRKSAGNSDFPNRLQ